MPQLIDPAELAALEHRDLGTSDWLVIDQERINQFADATGDHQFIHLDAERATPLFGGTIAHGYLTLSLSVHLMHDKLLQPTNHKQWINYGLNKVRFVAPVVSGSRVRLAMKCLDAVEKRPGSWLFTYDISMEIEGQDKPAYVAEFLMMSITG